MIARGLAAVTEQGLFAVAHFVLNVLLARWLLVDDYGYFAAMFAVLLGIGAIHSALFIEPMLVFGAGVYRPHQGVYIRFLVVSTLILSLIVALGGAVLLVPVAALGDNWLGVFALLWASPFVTGIWLLRRAGFVLERYRIVIYGGAAYFVSTVSFSFLAYVAGALTPNLAFVIIGTMSGVVGLWMFDRLLGWRRETAPNRFAYHVMMRHWAYGRWSLVGALLGWIPSNAPFLILPLTSGLEDSGELRALFNLALPMLHASSAVSVAFIPKFVTLTGPTLWRTFSRIVLISGACALLYGLLLGMVGEYILHWLYSGRYDGMALGLWWMSGLVLAASLAGACATLLRAKERLKPVAAGYLAAAGVACTTGVLFAIEWGVQGAMAGMVLSYVSAAAVMVLFLKPALKRSA